MKLGHVEVSKEFLAAEPDLFQVYFPDVQIHSGGADTEGHSILFSFECEEFDDLEVGDDIPTYLFVFDRAPDGTVTRRPAIKV